MFAASLAAMNTIPSPTPASASTLCRLVLRLAQDDGLTTFLPPINITPELSFAHILSTQSRLINAAALRMFFREHHIRTHLAMLRRFFLFGDGVFSSRLAQALFSDELDSTERVDGAPRTGGSMGLKLGSRESWPPASSELRLALMGVLTDSFSQHAMTETEMGIMGMTGATTAPGGIHAAGKEGELPGGLSFAVREMSEPELKACMDRDALGALDFLKLFYKPPRPLDALITPTALARYDRIFRLLLRVLRMAFVVNTLAKTALKEFNSYHELPSRPPPPPEATRFRLEATHFVTTVAAYMVETAVGTPWAAFDAQLARLDEHLDDTLSTTDTSSSTSTTEAMGLDRVRALHEAALDRIMFASLLRRRQEPVLKLLEDIFGVVLRFARHGPHDEVAAVAGLYAGFRRRVAIFINVCRGLGEKRGLPGNEDQNVNGGPLQHLLLRLEMSPYYSEK